mmetsp:Transcript_47478/g.148500  ORF Transcript_47478/g.148500 Transcript_47478/m.148500 type:complete len:126 (-) Transcript_47478:1463-1840(-)
MPHRACPVRSSVLIKTFKFSRTCLLSEISLSLWNSCMTLFICSMSTAQESEPQQEIAAEQSRQALKPFFLTLRIHLAHCLRYPRHALYHLLLRRGKRHGVSDSLHLTFHASHSILLLSDSDELLC